MNRKSDTMREEQQQQFYHFPFGELNIKVRLSAVVRWAFCPRRRVIRRDGGGRGGQNVTDKDRRKQKL